MTRLKRESKIKQLIKRCPTHESHLKESHFTFVANSQIQVLHGSKQKYFVTRTLKPTQEKK